MNYVLATSDERNKNIQNENIQTKQEKKNDTKPALEKKISNENKTSKLLP
jgi:hypothetical protein